MRAENGSDTFLRAFRQLMPQEEAPCFQVRFRPYAALRSKVRYDRNDGCVKADLSDMLREAPADVLEAVAATLLSKLYGRRVPLSARRIYRRWVNSPATQERMLVVRGARGRKHLLPPRGKSHDLSALFDQLNRRHFAGALDKPTLGWSQHAALRQLGHYDPAHDAISINRALDSPSVPQLAVGSVLYHDMLHIKHPVQLPGCRRCVHTPEFLAEERQFPGYSEARRMLKSLQLKY